MNHLPFQDHWKFESSSESQFEMPAPSNRNMFFYVFFMAHSAASIYEIISVRCFSAPTVSCIVMEVMPLPSARRAMR